MYHPEFLLRWASRDQIQKAAEVLLDLSDLGISMDFEPLFKLRKSATVKDAAEEDPVRELADKSRLMNSPMSLTRNCTGRRKFLLKIFKHGKTKSRLLEKVFRIPKLTKTQSQLLKKVFRNPKLTRTQSRLLKRCSVLPSSQGRNLSCSNRCSVHPSSQECYLSCSDRC